MAGSPTTARRKSPRRARPPQTPARSSAKPTPPSSSQSPEERLKVYLRIRALPPPERERPMAKEQKPRRQALVATGPSSVALTVPQSKLVNQKRRVRTDVFGGFSAILPPEASQLPYKMQHDIFSQVMNPLLDDFLGGKSCLLVMMASTGSRTIFGTARNPGVVPLTLQKIFSETNGSHAGTQSTRSFCFSMFEILCEGNAERILDLLSDAADLVLQQSTRIKGLQEVAISNFKDAEILVSRGMLKRSTAATNSNSESSRSQCIITLHATPGGPVLTIADLTDAERKKSTGDMGSRMLKSNFISNKSMVFGTCLRELLDYQKNKKKILEKHFKNSMLTRYLRDYLEGRKEMTLILDVKPGDDDYSNTSYLLRQASPYMKTSYTSLDDSFDLASQMRSSVSLICQEKKGSKVKPELFTKNPNEPESVSGRCEPMVEKTTSEDDNLCGQRPDVTNDPGGVLPHVLDEAPSETKASIAKAPTKDRRQAEGTTDEKDNYPAQRITVDKKEGHQEVEQEDLYASKPSQKSKKTTRCSSPPHDGEMTAETLPDDSLLEIISRVPTRERWRCKQVCKRWLRIARNLPQSLAGFFYTSHSMERFPMSALHFFNISSRCRQRPLIYPSFDFLPGHRQIDLLDCCNGLLLCRWFGASAWKFRYIVCNPATKEWVVLPYSWQASGEVIDARLGFDPVESSHFHVFLMLGKDKEISGVGLYSSETGRWVRKEKGWDQEVFCLDYFGGSVFLNGYLHFLVHDYKNDPYTSLAAVATDGETWNIISLPGQPDKDLATGFVQLSQGCLHYVCFEECDEVAVYVLEVAVYVLEDYDSKQWKLKHRVAVGDMFGEEESELWLYESNWYLIADDFEWISIHPECNVIFFARGPDKLFMCYNMDLRKVTENRRLNDGKSPYLPYVPLYTELQSLRMGHMS